MLNAKGDVMFADVELPVNGGYISGVVSRREDRIERAMNTIDQVFL